MSTIQIEGALPIAPSEMDVLLAGETSRRLTTLLGKKSVHQMQILADDQANEVLVVPDSAMRLFAHILSEMAKGNAVTLMPNQKEITTQQAADMLNVSRPFLIQLLEKGEIPYHKIGSHRRIRLEDVMCYKQDITIKRRAALDELAAQAQELGMGY